ncbi:uncharacterized protein LOC105166686 isoform X1 [Sesamum indicum]|uniref:Uncharacterized protein LOC105166686 isoform X1 n=1 Tax=Sesamum indicum TaxID=4182 RepID=A0A6I9TH97_SESIN|nr:uncharacterized protein LOC105166686 isoform X1 [Sesamum indicum]XP_011084434.1 uncharacterized protein LOC105166686 isoform X1 [Sesamum indicum]
MPVAKLCTSGIVNAMKSEGGNDYLDTFIRQAIGKEPLLPFPRTGNSPVQWIQLLHALDQPDLPGWPLMTPVKVQMQKCEKCPRQFCSPINYRRHIRVHRRSLNVNKESHRNRELLAEFWDKLSPEEAKEIVSLNDVMLKEIPGSSVIRALTSSLQKPGLWTLPQAYVKAGSTLLDIVQAKPSRLPLSSQELFGILDDASETTFLCGGASESLQKYVFDGEAANNSMELKNLVASTSFLFEQKLVKAWVADKDAEALRCHKLLVEEEEAAQKKQAELLERKKQKKLRQKEQKVKEQFYECNADLDVPIGAADGLLDVPIGAADGPISAEGFGSSSPSDSSSNSIEAAPNLDSCIEPIQSKSIESDKDREPKIDANTECLHQGDCQSNEPQMVAENCHQHLANNHWQVTGSQMGNHASQNLQLLEPEFGQAIGLSEDHPLLNGSKVWTKEHKTENNGESLKPSLSGEICHQMEESNCEVIIGSISVTVNNPAAQQQHCHPYDDQDTSRTQHAMLNNTSEKLLKEAAAQSGPNRMASKLWRPVSHGEAKRISSIERRNKDSERAVPSGKVHDRIMSSERCMPSQSADIDDHDDVKQNNIPCDKNDLKGNVAFSSIAAKEFLSQRWKEAISADHVKLVLSVGHEPPGCSAIQHDNSMASNNPDRQECSAVCRSGAQVKFRTKPDKCLKTKYIAKPKAIT